jgi:hypothetical protein
VQWSSAYERHLKQRNEKWSARASQVNDGEHDLQVYDTLSDSIQTTLGVVEANTHIYILFWIFAFNIIWRPLHWQSTKYDGIYIPLLHEKSLSYTGVRFFHRKSNLCKNVPSQVTVEKLNINAFYSLWISIFRQQVRSYEINHTTDTKLKYLLHYILWNITHWMGSQSRVANR